METPKQNPARDPRALLPKRAPKKAQLQADIDHELRAEMDRFRKKNGQTWPAVVEASFRFYLDAVKAK